MSTEIKIKSWPDKSLSGSKRTNIVQSDAMRDWDWFVGYGKNESCQFEGSWFDMVCFARNVLASENTKLAAPEFYKPEWQNDNYIGLPPYEFGDK